MKALVTGATGFIGSHLAEELLKKGYRVTCLVRRTSNLKWIEGLNLDLVHGDCEDEESLKDIPTDFDYVFHVAGLTKAKREEDFFSVNVKGTENVLKAASERIPGLKRFVYLSSLAAAGPSGNGTPLNESSASKPVSEYGKSKLEGEEAVQRYKGRMPFTIIRPPVIYGPRDKDFYVFFKMLKKGFYPYWGKCYYSLLYVDDLVRGVIMAAEQKEAEGKTYFLSDRNIHSNEDIVKEISDILATRLVKVRLPQFILAVFAGIGGKLSGKLSIINRDKLRELRHVHWTCDSSQAEKDFNFFPKVSIKEGMKWTADWYRIHQWL